MDEKIATKVQNAAKRLSRKRPSTGTDSDLSKKKPKQAASDEPLTPAAIEKSLTLPSSEADEKELLQTVLHTNRAPLVLAFAVTLLKYTMPSQPLSSRLSLAQAVVSANSRSKAVSIGLESGPTAEQDGWGLGQPSVRIMGREIRALKRWGYNAAEGSNVDDMSSAKIEPLLIKEEPVSQASSAKTLKDEAIEQPETEPALWGLDLEALRSKSGQPYDRAVENLPIFTPQSARAYLVKSFASASPTEEMKGTKKKSGTALAKEKETNLALLLRALDLLYASWTHAISSEELDRKAWSWYVHVRPEVASGVAGWGGKGEVKLSEILRLRRAAS